MFRENVLVNEEIINRVTESMVPVSLDYQKVLDRQSAESRFLRPLMKQRDQEQGLWIFSPDGNALGGFSGFGDMVTATRRVIEDALTAHGPVALRAVSVIETHPFRGHSFRADGGVCLAEYVRRQNDSQIRTPVISSVNLTAEEFGEFAPRRSAVGEQWAVAEPVAKKLCRVASPMCYQHAPQPDWVKDVVVKATVQSIQNGLAEIRYDGKVSSERHWRDGRILSQQELTLSGEGIYDVAAASMRSLLIVGSGTFRWPEEAPDEIVPFDALIEWQAGAAESVPQP